jgi:hypothetical protein
MSTASDPGIRRGTKAEHILWGTCNIKLTWMGQKTCTLILSIMCIKKKLPIMNQFPCTHSSLLFLHFTGLNSDYLTYLFTPWSRVLLEKQTGLQLVNKFPAFYGTWRFINAFTSARHLSISWASSIQSISPDPNSWRCNYLTQAQNMYTFTTLDNSCVISALIQ